MRLCAPGNELSIVGLVTRQNMSDLPEGLASEDNLAGRDSHHELEHGGEAHEHDDFDSFSLRLTDVVSKDHLLATIEQTITIAAA